MYYVQIQHSILINSFTFLLNLLNLVLILAKFETLKGNDTIIFFGGQKCLNTLE